jgi:hypothetical protein
MKGLMYQTGNMEPPKGQLINYGTPGQGEGPQAQKKLQWQYPKRRALISRQIPHEIKPRPIEKWSATSR